jgi:hypothetical protein
LQLVDVVVELVLDAGLKDWKGLVGGFKDAFAL